MPEILDAAFLPRQACVLWVARLYSYGLQML